MSQHNSSNEMRLDYRKDGLHFDWLPFATDIVFFVANIEVASKQSEVLKINSRENSVQISFEKAEYMYTDTQDPNWTIKPKYGDIKSVQKFK